MTGTLINIVAVLIGGGVGVFLGDRLPERIRETVMHGLGLVTLIVGISLALETNNTLIPLGSVIIGSILGEWWHIDCGLERASDWLKAKVSRRIQHKSMGLFTEGFITASLVFCVGPLTVLGSIQDGLSGDYSLLAIKSMLDGFAALAFGSSLGVGVLFSVITLLVYQGGLSLLAGVAQNALSTNMITEMSAVGGIMIMALGLLLLDLKKIRVANMLPGLIIAPLVVAVVEALGYSL